MAFCRWVPAINLIGKKPTTIEIKLLNLMDSKNGLQETCINHHMHISIVRYTTHSYSGFSLAQKYSYSWIWRLHPFHQGLKYPCQRVLSNGQAELPERPPWQKSVWTLLNRIQFEQTGFDRYIQTGLQQQIRQN